jgi:hypothetical protein
MMQPPTPPRVTDATEFWQSPPPEPSPRLVYWQARIEAGWMPNKRIRAMGYHEAAEFFGVYIWEYLNVLAPLFSAPDVSSGAAVSSPAVGGTNNG